MVAGLAPWWLTGWHLRHGYPLPARIAGAGLTAAGSVVLITAFARFIRDGIGTPAPIAPTQQLVVRGPYRYVRNPMYLGVLLVLVAEAIIFPSHAFLVYIIFFFAVVNVFIVTYEEPALQKQFGESYKEYCRRVSRWIPRFSA
jgi:protein-S-isoprenylcysteine O-methyltransferase Ste14